MPARADLHVHSKFSNRPTEWLLQRAAAAESYTEPLDLYRKAKARGMDFVTISDHDTIDGALEIAHLPGAFLSCEATVTFPEDGCQIHLLTFGITEAQFGTIDRLRGNVYELRDYLKGEGILCSVAHPLFRVNERLTLAHLEKLLVLFDRFEARNGIHDAGEADLVRRILSSLTPEMAWDLAERHRLEFWGERPWEKSFTGGSDDHGGHYIATTWTETPDADEPFGYLAHLHAGLAEPGGEAGSSRRLTQSLYAIAADWHRRAVPFWALGARFDPFARLLGDLARPAETARRESDPVERASAVGREVVRKLARRIERKVKRGKFGSALEGLAELAPLGLALAPHLIAVRAQSKDRDLIASAAARFGAGRTGGEKRLWWIDDPEELVSPSAAARGLFAEVARRGGSIEAVLCGPGNPDSPAGDASGF
ncbi:MAG TPA: hypothetical protein VN783_05245, partial [Thermoanaerobaculia bacterium]|nr:hypothetical protein [Thermoanaerobaculia bacterium]